MFSVVNYKRLVTGPLIRLDDRISDDAELSVSGEKFNLLGTTLASRSFCCVQSGLIESHITIREVNP